MVNAGKPSNGCFLCRKRRVKVSLPNSSPPISLYQSSSPTQHEFKSYPKHPYSLSAQR